MSRGGYTFVVLAAALPAVFLSWGGAGPPGTQPVDGKKPKKIKAPAGPAGGEESEPSAGKKPGKVREPKPPPDENEEVDRAVSKLLRGPKTERDRLLED